MRLPNEPVKNTCPDINQAQKTIQQIINNFQSFKETDDISDFMDAISDANWELKSIIDTFEELRNSNSALRDWGHELTSLAEQMESEKDSEIEELQNEISEKETEIEDLEEEIDILKQKFL